MDQQLRSFDPSDEQLAGDAASGSVESFEQLVRRYQVPLLRFLQRKFPRRSDAEDVIQEAFLRAYQSLGQYRIGAPFKPWLFTIAYRLSIDQSRRMRIVSDAASDDLPDSSDTPADRAASNDSADHLWNVVRGALNEECYTAVWLHYGQDLSTTEIAGVLNRSRVWVKTTLLRSRGKIKQAMNDRAVKVTGSVAEKVAGVS
jgi:RNA polymerase sigma-70 factor (ECF subfamily)